ncbi:MAG: cysteine hydrolase [Methanobacteriota archaeon]|nr:MAG: cysteine hydrolase [Euryarchaeota archaeon]
MVGSELKTKARRWLDAIRPYRSSHRETRFPFLSTSSALLVIDMQKYFLHEGSHACLPMGRAVLENVQKLVSCFRGANRPVIYTRHGLLDDEPAGVMDRWWGDSLRYTDPLSEIAAEIAPVQGDVVLRKTRYNAFIRTSLDSVLRAAEVERLVITGVMTHLCCESTARDAFMRDFEVYFVVDGTASSDEELHLSSLRTLTDGFAIPVTTEEVLEWMRR